VLWPWPEDQDLDLNEVDGPGWIDAAGQAARQRLTEGDGQAVIGHGDWWTENLRWQGNRLLVAYDWDSLITDSEAVIAGLGAAIYPALATVTETRDFLAVYATTRGRPFSPGELRHHRPQACGHNSTPNGTPPDGQSSSLTQGRRERLPMLARSAAGERTGAAGPPLRRANQTRRSPAHDQGKISEIMRDIQRVIALEVFERIADGLSMPAPARAILGLAPRQYPASTGTVTARLVRRPAVLIPPQDVYQGEGLSSAPSPPTVDLPGGEEDPVRRRSAAASTASSFAQRLDRDLPAHDRESLSVYGSLLLRGATAAAQRNDRATAHELLTDARDAGHRLGADANLRWTAFGPTNVTLHRVHIAVTLGDAGTAIDTARSINLDQVPVTERKASLLIDTARAFLQYGKHENAYLALRAARDIAPEEIAGRPRPPAPRDLITSAPSESSARPGTSPAISKSPGDPWPRAVVIARSRTAADAGKLVRSPAARLDSQVIATRRPATSSIPPRSKP
jgi:hypothetical protein